MQRWQAVGVERDAKAAAEKARREAEAGRKGRALQ